MSQPVPPPADPTDPIAAVTHPDPYPYYSALAADRPFEHHPDLGLWVAASAEAVAAVLVSDLVRVRPPAEPVPRALAGGPAGEIFSRLVRMNDGPRHAAWKPAVSAVLGAVDAGRMAEAGRREARRLVEELGAANDPGRIDELAFALPARVLAGEPGVPADRRAQTAEQVGDFARALAPGCPASAIEHGHAAAGQLLAEIGPLAAPAGAGLAAALARELRRGEGPDSDAVAVANGIGFLSQAYEATAGLIGNTLRALAARPALARAAAVDPAFLRSVIEEVVRFDPPVQNTRRFVATAGTIAGREVAEGDAILVVLAAANRDPAANPDPGAFEPARPERRSFTFGLSSHACPGATLAIALAEAAVRELLAAGLDLGEISDEVRFRRSVNVRIPVFGSGPSSS